jgi:hypothetical protein
MAATSAEQKTETTMWGKKKSDDTEELIHSWKQRDFDSLLNGLTGTLPRVSFLLTGSSNSVDLGSQDYPGMRRTANVHGVVYHPRIRAEGRISIGQSDCGLGHIQVESRVPSGDRDGYPMVTFSIELQDDHDFDRLSHAIENGLLGNKPVELTLHVAEIENPSVWARNFAEKGYARHLSIARISLSSQIGKSHPDAFPIF